MVHTSYLLLSSLSFCVFSKFPTINAYQFYSQKKVTAEEKLEELYRSYTDRKLRKIVKDEQYRQDARTLAQRILDERDVTGEHE